jgi:hypothetical protein
MIRSYPLLALSAFQALLLTSISAQAAQGIGARWERSSASRIEWSDHAFEEIRRQGDVLTESEPKDVGQFCSNYSSLRKDEKREFWVHLISAMSELESSHKASLQYRESFRNSQGQQIVSRGLLQLSLESANAYGCRFKKASYLDDPLRNLSCGIKILGHWVGRDGRIAGRVKKGWRGGSRYWAVLRTEKRLKQIQSWSKAYCSKRFD